MHSSRQCGKIFGSLETLKKHQLRHGQMKYLCQVCGQNFPFPSDLATHKTVHSEEKNFKSSYPKCGKSYKTKAEYNCHYNYRHKQKLAKSKEIKCSICCKICAKVKYLKKHMKSHVDDPIWVPLLWCMLQMEVRLQKTQMKSIKKKVLVMNSKLFFLFDVFFG